MKISPSALFRKALHSKAPPEFTDEHLTLVKQIFDENYYRTQLNGSAIQATRLADHYLRNVSNPELDPHPLFSTNFYLSVNTDVAEAAFNPLLHYMLHGRNEGRQFHPLFDVNFYKKQLGEPYDKERNWLKHYIEVGSRKGISPHPLFDVGYYREQLDALRSSRLRDLSRRAALEPELLATPDLCHYVTHGWKIGLSPNRYFDVAWYLTANRFQLREGLDPFSHYLMQGYRESPTFHPAFDTKYYETQAGLVPGADNALLKFISEKEDRGTRSCPNPFIDGPLYVESNADIKQNNLCPYLHFICYGYREPARRINRILSQPYIYAQNPTESLSETTAYVHYFKSRRERPKKRLVFIGHEASRTGAPLILLQLMRRVQLTGEFDLFLILGRGGDLEAEYAAVAHVLVARHEERVESIAHYLLDMMGDDQPVAVIANSVETRKFANVFGAMGIKTTMLVHEMMDVYYDPTEAQHDLVHINHIVFPAEYVKNGFLRYLSYPVEKTAVIPQGLLDPRFGMGVGRESAKALVCEEFSFPPSATLVIGCGTVDFRKGVDYFVQVAKAMIARAGADESLCFLWIGKIVSYEFRDLYYWLQYEIKKSSLEHRIKFRGEAHEVEDYFAAADLFLLTSRADPFPCVCHEAMAARVPIVTFEESGGMPEVLRQGAGLTVPFGDVSAMADAALDLLGNAEKKSSIIDCAMRAVKEQFDFDRYAEKILRLSAPISTGEGPKRTIRRASGEQIKVFFSACDWEISGVNTQVTHLVEGLNKRGFDAKVLFTRGRFTYFTGEKLGLPDLPSHFLQPGSTGHWDVWKTTQSFLEGQAPCIYVPNYDYVASAISPGLHNRVGIVGIAHSDDAEHYEHVHRLGAYWNRIVAVSDQVLEGVGRLNSSYLGKSTMIPYGVPIHEFAARPIREFSAEHPIRLIYLGRFVRRQKRIFDYVSLAKVLDARNIPFHLTMVGDGAESAEVARQLAVQVNQGKVSLPGRFGSDEVQKLLSEADILLLLSDFEGLPLALLEAMERGCVPICYDIKSGIPMIVKDGRNGIIIPHGRVDKIADAITDLIKVRKSFAELAVHAREDFVNSNFTDDAMCDRYAEIFRTVISEIKDGSYNRPRKFLTLHSKMGNILPPPFLQSV